MVSLIHFVRKKSVGKGAFKNDHGKPCDNAGDKKVNGDIGWIPQWMQFWRYDQKQGAQGRLMHGGKYDAESGAEAFDMQKNYVELISGFIGFKDVISIIVEPTLQGGPDTAQEKLAEAIVQAQKIAVDFWYAILYTINKRVIDEKRQYYISNPLAINVYILAIIIGICASSFEERFFYLNWKAS